VASFPCAYLFRDNVLQRLKRRRVNVEGTDTNHL
jgi:hypothetical protein